MLLRMLLVSGGTSTRYLQNVLSGVLLLGPAAGNHVRVVVLVTGYNNGCVLVRNVLDHRLHTENIVVLYIHGWPYVSISL